MKPIPHGAGAVMASRIEPPTSLDFFPTPPWATRAFCEHVINIGKCSVWEPACGTGTMAGPLEEYAKSVFATDVYDYGRGFQVHDFLQPYVPRDLERKKRVADWVVTNPPFRLAVEFAERGLDLKTNVALLVRSVWAEGGDRYRRLFSPRPPAIIAQFVERVPMTRGAWKPDASTATSYAWFVWTKCHGERQTTFEWIPSGCRKTLTMTWDKERYA